MDNTIIEESSFKIKTSKAKGILYGMFVGDALGSSYEFQTIEYPVPNNKLQKPLNMQGGGRFKLPPGGWTDDSSQGACLNDALIYMEVIYSKTGIREFPSKYFMESIYLWNKKGTNSGLSKSYPHVSIGLGSVVSQAINNWEIQRSKPSADPASSLVEYRRKNGLENELCDGNGSTMRYGACAVFAKSVEEAMQFAYLQSIVTTPGRESADCSRLLAFLTYEAMHSKITDPLALKTWLLSKENLERFVTIANMQSLPKLKSDDGLTNLDYKTSGTVKLTSKVLQLCHPEEATGDDIFINWRVSSEHYKLNPKQSKKGYYGAYVTEGVALVLNAFLNTNSFEELISTLALACGDADSNAAVAGQLAGAVYGVNAIPKTWIDDVNKHPLNQKTNSSDTANVTQFIDNAIQIALPQPELLAESSKVACDEKNLTGNNRNILLPNSSNSSNQNVNKYPDLRNEITKTKTPVVFLKFFTEDEAIKFIDDHGIPFIPELLDKNGKTLNQPDGNRIPNRWIVRLPINGTKNGNPYSYYDDFRQNNPGLDLPDISNIPEETIPPPTPMNVLGKKN